MARGVRKKRHSRDGEAPPSPPFARGEERTPQPPLRKGGRERPPQPPLRRGGVRTSPSPGEQP